MDVKKGWMKPVGLWFSVNDDEDGWRSWCEGKSFRLDELKHKTELILKPNANILYLRSSKCFDTFTEKYVGKTRLPGLLGRLHQEWPDWESVAKEYDGIIIAPYNWEYRLNPETI